MQISNHSNPIDLGLPGGEKIYTAPENTGQVVLGRNLVSLLEEACRSLPNPKAFNQKTEEGWLSLSNG